MSRGLGDVYKRQIQILMRWSLQKLFIGGFTDEEGEVFTNKYLTAGVRQ